MLNLSYLRPLRILRTHLVSLRGLQYHLSLQIERVMLELAGDSCHPNVLRNDLALKQLPLGVFEVMVRTGYLYGARSTCNLWII